MIRRFLALLCLLFSCVGQVYSQSIPPTNNNVLSTVFYRTDNTTYWPTSWAGPYGQTAQEFCEAAVARISGAVYTGTRVGGNGNPTCDFFHNGYNRSANGERRYGCPDTSITTTWSSQNWCTYQSCPVDYKLENGVCVPDLCPLGYDRDASGQCVKDCTAKRGMSLPNTHYRVGESGNGALGGCKFNCDTRVKFAIAVFGDPDNEPQPEWISTGCRYTGQPGDEGDYNAEGTGSDVPPPDKPTKPDDCMAQGMGYIQSSSGQTNCVPSSSAPPAQKPDEVRHDRNKESGKPGANGAPDPNAPGYKQEKESHTSKGGDIISQKEERIRQPGYDQGSAQPCPDGYVSDGQGFCVKSSAERQKEQDFCRDRPNEPICKTINEGAPNQNKPSTDGKTCKEGDKTAACSKLDTPPDGDIIPQDSIAVTSIGPVAVASNASCPQGPTLPFGIGYFPMDGLCMYASGLRPIIIALAWLSAGLIVFGAIRE